MASARAALAGDRSGEEDHRSEPNERVDEDGGGLLGQVLRDLQTTGQVEAAIGLHGVREIVRRESAGRDLQPRDVHVGTVDPQDLRPHRVLTRPDTCRK